MEILKRVKAQKAPSGTNFMDERQLIAQIKAKNQEAMVRLYQKCCDLVYSILARILNDDSAAEESLQDVFLKVWQNIGQYDEQRGTLTAWVIGIARNEGLDKRRKLSRQPVQAIQDDLRDNVTADGDQVHHLRMTVKTLPPEQIQVIELSYYGGMSQSDIADYLGIPLGTVKTRMRLAMQKLKEAWLHDDE